MPSREAHLLTCRRSGHSAHAMAWATSLSNLKGAYRRGPVTTNDINAPAQSMTVAAMCAPMG